MGFEPNFLASAPRMKYALPTTRNPHFTKLGIASAWHLIILSKEFKVLFVHISKGARFRAFFMEN